MAKIEPPQAHEQFNIREQNDFRKDLSEKERLDFSRENKKLFFGYAIVSVGFLAAILILFVPSMKEFHIVALSILSGILATASAYVFNNVKKND
jgi:hypothetical protein